MKRAACSSVLLALLLGAGEVSAQALPGADAPPGGPSGPSVGLQRGVVYPRPGASFETRVLNRRQVSHILIENEDGHSYLTMLVVHARYWAYHAMPHALRYPCRDASECLRELKRLDAFLKTGWNLGLRLDGSLILELIYYPPPQG
ncbi:MAG: hypothetical protein K1X75_11540 [Leptospirales bacterium]|nr:hypothetical protein [Leptospirales bacterium]